MRIAALALVGAAALVLAGCTPTGHPTATPKPSATPVFASDAAALKAAEKAYAAYLLVSDRVAANGGVGADSLKPFVTRERFQVEQQGADLLKKNGVHASGATTFRNSSLERTTTAGRETTIVFYTCWDVGSVRVLDAAGNDVTPESRPNTQTLEVTMSTQDGHLPLLLANDESWSGASVC